MKADKSVIIWIFITAASVFVMALIGAITRLTESGLSITEWRPIAGALPPLNAGDWQREFDLYRQSPQYQQINAGMSLAEFKFIYFWEWVHRQWGRLIGLIYILPLVWFWMRGQLPKGYGRDFLLLLALGAGQGFMGWFMVQSGLIDQPAVSHYRLAAHLILAFAIFALLVHLGLRLVRTAAPVDQARALIPLFYTTLGLALVTMTWGAFVAGLNAGLIYNEFPLMGTYPWPSEVFHYQPWWINFFENHASVQFAHRLLAVLTLAHLFLLWRKARRLSLPPQTQKIFATLFALGLAQAAVGIVTLITAVAMVPAVLHQALAMGLLALFAAAATQLPIKKGVR